MYTKAVNRMIKLSQSPHTWWSINKLYVCPDPVKIQFSSPSHWEPVSLFTVTPHSLEGLILKVGEFKLDTVKDLKKKPGVPVLPSNNGRMDQITVKTPNPKCHLYLCWIEFKGTVSWDRFQKFWPNFKELDLSKGRGWCLSFLGAPMIL